MASHSMGLSCTRRHGRRACPSPGENEPADRTIQIDGMTFHFLEWGDPVNPTILMLHGGSQQGHSWDFVSLPLSEQYHVWPWTSEATATVTGLRTETIRWRPSTGYRWVHSSTNTGRFSPNRALHGRT